jgi:RNA polymerase sigma-70 factor (ECF subfamily)
MSRQDDDARRTEPVQAAAIESVAPPPIAPAVPAPPFAALEAIFEQHHRAVFRAAYRLTGNSMDAEDVLQTVFARLLRHPLGAGALDLSQSAGSYLHRAAVNAALDLLRSRRRHRVVALAEEHDLIDDRQPGPEHASRNLELSRRLRAALAQLSPRQAEVFALRYLEGLGNLEIARLLGSSQTAIAVILHRARHRLQRELKSLEGDLS